MRPMTVAAAILLPLGATLLAPRSTESPPGTTADPVRVNDNRLGAGTLRGGILTIRLEVRQGEWHPDADTSVGLQVRAFAEEGKALQIPGPLIRVVEGTEIRAFIRNTVSDAPLIMHGLHARGAAP